VVCAPRLAAHSLYLYAPTAAAPIPQPAYQTRAMVSQRAGRTPRLLRRARQHRRGAGLPRSGGKHRGREYPWPEQRFDARIQGRRPVRSPCTLDPCGGHQQRRSLPRPVLPAAAYPLRQSDLERVSDLRPALLLALFTGMIGGHDYHRRHSRPRPALAGNPAPAAPTPTPLRRSAPRRRPRRPGRHHLSVAYRRPWRLLPTQQLGCGSPVACWRRLRDWQRAGVWQRLHHLLLDQLGREGRLDWSRASIDSLSVRAKRGASRPARTRPTGASRGPNTTCWSTTAASRWPSGSRRPTLTTPCCWSRSWMPSPRSRAHGPAQGGPASGRPSCTATRECATRRHVTGWDERTHRWAVAAARLKLGAA